MQKAVINLNQIKWNWNYTSAIKRNKDNYMYMYCMGDNSL